MKSMPAALIAAGMMLLAWSGPAQASGSGDSCPAKGPDQPVVLYATDWCPYCQRVRRLFAENEVAYCEYDVESSAAGHRRFRELGGQGVPVIVIGRRVIHGYSKGRIIEALFRQGLI